MKIYLPFLYFLTSLLTRPTHGDVYTAIYKLSELSHVEGSLLMSLRNYIESEQAADSPVNPDIKSFLNKTQKQNTQLATNAHYVENPLNAFRMLYRIHNSWDSLLEKLNCPDCENSNNTEAFIEKFSSIKDLLWPTEKDVFGAAMALFRLREVYQLNLTELIQGRIADIQTNPMTTEEVLTLTKIANDKDMVYEEILWLLALNKLYKEGRVEKGTVSPEKILRALSSAYFNYGMPWESLKYVQRCLEIIPQHKGCMRDLNFFEMKLKSIPEYKRTKKLEKGELESDKEQYEALCRGDNILPDAAVAQLKCFLRPMSVPYERVKEEVLSYNPRIAMYHEVITDHEIEHVMKQSREKLFRSTVAIGDNDKENSEWSYRVSQSAWLWDSDRTTRKIAQRIERVTGLNTEIKVYASSAEPFQIINYGVGGMYEPHFDYFEGDVHVFNRLRQGAGARLAVWMIYLSDVMLGGATVFPKLGVRVPVKKASAVFWYNFNKKHIKDPRTLHAGCPVVIGSKWVSNKWIRENGQTFRRMCGLKKNAQDD